MKVEKTVILLVTSEVELWGAENLRLALSAAGYRVVAASSGEARHSIGRIKPVLTIANLTGDHPEDRHLCKQLARPDFPPMDVIGSSIGTSHLLELFASGICDYLTRPVNPLVLVARVHNIVRRRQLPSQTTGTAVSLSQRLTGFKPARAPLTKVMQALAKRLNHALLQRQL